MAKQSLPSGIPPTTRGGGLPTFLLIASLILTACGKKQVNTEDLPVCVTYTYDPDETDETDDPDETDDTDETEGIYVNKYDPSQYTGGDVSVSEDGRFTVESKMWSGPESWTKWTIKDQSGKSHAMMAHSGAYQSKVHSIKKADGSVYYIVDCFEPDGPRCYDWLSAYQIVGDTVQKVSVTDGKTEPDVDDGNFAIHYCIPACVDAISDSARWIQYDAKTRSLCVPITLDRELIDRYRLWRFDGERFVDMGDRPNKQLHKSLGDYVCLICSHVTVDCIVRVDSLASRELRMALWRKPKTQGDKPDVVVAGGRRHAIEGKDYYDEYRFYNGEYEYIVDFSEFGRRSVSTYLLVKKNKQIVIKQEYTLPEK